MWASFRIVARRTVSSKRPIVFTHAQGSRLLFSRTDHKVVKLVRLQAASSRTVLGASLCNLWPSKSSNQFVGIFSQQLFDLILKSELADVIIVRPQTSWNPKWGWPNIGEQDFE